MCLDAASYVSTQRLDLSKYKPEFVALSFYKIFGFPTGVGALVVRKGMPNVSNERWSNSSVDAVTLLTKRYFGGGTVAASLAGENYRKFPEDPSMRFEDGTVNFLSIIALKHGFELIQKLTIERISSHTSSLTKFLCKQLRALTHSNGAFGCFLGSWLIDSRN